MKEKGKFCSPNFLIFFPPDDFRDAGASPGVPLDAPAPVCNMLQVCLSFSSSVLLYMTCLCT